MPVASLGRSFRRLSGAGRQHADGYADRVQAELEAARLIRASADAMLDPQVILKAVRRDGRVVDLIHRDINEAG